MYNCNVCVREFTSKRNYNMHLESDLHKSRCCIETVMFSCDCGRKFNQIAGLSRHKKTCRHLTSMHNSNNFKCNICKHNYSSKQAFDRHMKSITHLDKCNNRKSYDCFCGKKYFHRQSLFNHHKYCEQYKNHDTNPSQPSTPPLQTSVATVDASTNTEPIKEKNKSKSYRSKISHSTRQYILERQENRCGDCKINLGAYFQIDHIMALQFGGDNSLTNLMALCCECHAKKSLAENACRQEIQNAIKIIISRHHESLMIDS